MNDELLNVASVIAKFIEAADKEAEDKENLTTINENSNIITTEGSV